MGVEINTAGFLRNKINDDQGMISRDFLKYLQNLENRIVTPIAFKVAALPVQPTPLEGSMAFASNGRKQGEGPGLGTGVPVYYSNGFWRRYSDDTQVAS